MKRRKNAESGANWMDTYGDMVTLLLCFFVLLYTISSVDQQKFENLVASINPQAVEKAAEGAGAGTGQGNGIGQGNGAPGPDEDFQAIADNLEEEMERLGVGAEVQIATMDGYHFISYKDEVFFTGDSAIITDHGKKVLDGFCKAISKSAKHVKEIRVLGHTTQIDPKRPNNISKDRALAAERSANVVIYIQTKGVLDPSRLVSVGYGQFRPIADVDTEKGRERNRRAEIIITDKAGDEKDVGEYYEEVYGDEYKDGNKGKSGKGGKADKGGETKSEKSSNED